MRWTVVAVLALVVGCSSGFTSEREELAYLSSLSNPTPVQWRRREELRGKEEREAIIRAAEYRSTTERVNAAAEAERAARPRVDPGPVTVKKYSGDD